MKTVQLRIHYLIRHRDGETYVDLFKDSEAARDFLYERVVEDWENCFGSDGGDDQLDNYDTKDEAIEHYYSYSDEWYELNWETLTYTVVELQDEIAKAIGLATHG